MICFWSWTRSLEYIQGFALLMHAGIAERGVCAWGDGSKIIESASFWAGFNAGYGAVF